MWFLTLLTDRKYKTNRPPKTHHRISEQPCNSSISTVSSYKVLLKITEKKKLRLFWIQGTNFVRPVFIVLYELERFAGTTEERFPPPFPPCFVVAAVKWSPCTRLQRYSHTSSPTARPVAAVHTVQHRTAPSDPTGFIFSSKSADAAAAAIARDPCGRVTVADVPPDRVAAFSGWTLTR